MTVDDTLREIRESLIVEQAAGTWKPQPGDPLSECEFVRAGFRAWGLGAPDKAWRLHLSRLDFGDSNPSALLTVYAPGHDAAFGDLGWFVFSHSIGVNGGTNFNQAIKRLAASLGGAEQDWSRRIVYLIARARDANAGSNNGTASWAARPAVPTTAQPFVFLDRFREGRTVSVFGPGSAGKSTLVDGLLASACSGVEIVPGWLPSRPYTSLTLDWDEGREEIEVRLSAICHAYDVNLTAGYHYKRMSRPLYDVADEIGAYIVGNGIELVVVSPVGRAIRDHGDNISAPIDELYEILRSFGSTNILIDHVTGANMSGGAEREFGAVRKRDNARGSYSLYAQSEGVGNRVVVLKNTKPDAMSAKVPPQAVRIEYDPPAGRSGVYDRITYHRDQVNEGQVGVMLMAPAETQPARLVRVLQEHGSLSATRLCALTGFDARRLRDIVREARGKGAFIVYENGAYALRIAPDDD